MKRLLLCVLALAIVTPSALADPPSVPLETSPNQLSALMRMKLDRSKAILEGLTLEDYAKIAQNARALRLLSMEAGWNVLQTREYAEQSEDFRRSVDQIAGAAAEKDINRAALGYVALTVRCVECHSYMRRHRLEQMKLEPQ